jgi:oligopeptide transport system ATP-binding protein
MNIKDCQDVLRVSDLRVRVPVKRKVGPLILRKEVEIIHGLSFAISRGKTLGIVGESGCGKSTTALSSLGLIPRSAKSISVCGHEACDNSKKAMSFVRRHVSIVLQNPMESLDPRKKLADSIAQPLWVHNYGSRREVEKRVTEVLDLVALSSSIGERYPHEVSGGQRQRVAIARAITLNPILIVCDEPLAALDVSIQSQIMNLLQRLQQEIGMSYLFISHDLASVRYLCDTVAVMYSGDIVEMGENESFFEKQLHPYSKALLSAVPVPDPKVERGRQHILLEGDVPSIVDPPEGCPFRPRCPSAQKICGEKKPAFEENEKGGCVACHFA